MIHLYSIQETYFQCYDYLFIFERKVLEKFELSFHTIACKVEILVLMQPSFRMHSKSQVFMLLVQLHHIHLQEKSWCHTTTINFHFALGDVVLVLSSSRGRIQILFPCIILEHKFLILFQVTHYTCNKCLRIKLFSYILFIIKT